MTVSKEGFSCVDGRCCEVATFGAWDRRHNGNFDVQQEQLKYDKKVIGTRVCECGKDWAGPTCKSHSELTSPNSDTVWSQNSTGVNGMRVVELQLNSEIRLYQKVVKATR